MNVEISADRLTGLTIGVTDAYTDPDHESSTWTICVTDTTFTGHGERRYFYCSTTLQGRFVSLYSHSPRILAFCEVEVYSKHGT